MGLLERYCSEEPLDKPAEIPSIFLGKTSRIDLIYQDLLASDLQKDKSAVVLLQNSNYETAADLY